MIKNKKFMEFLESYDIIIPVPISKTRMKNRGYNQSFLIAREIVTLYNKSIQKNKLKIEQNCLYKNKNTIEQSKLNKEQRINNVQGVYMIKNKQIPTNKRILLVDDIFTAGSTIKQCSQMIKKTKPATIGVLTIARDFINKRKE